MSDLYFLEASVLLTKSFTLNANGIVTQSSYPMVKDFTSHKESVSTPLHFFNALIKHAKLGHCVLKGEITTPLNNEPRAGSTQSEAPSWWMCLDMDSAPFNSPQEFMDSEPALRDLSYVVQYSASSGLQTATGLNCHIFVLLDKPVRAPVLKAWLISRNLESEPGILREALSLSNSKAALHYTLDITASQNDKLIYIGTPNIGKGVPYKLKTTELIQLIPGKLTHMPVERLTAPNIEVVRKEARDILNAKRKEAGLDVLRSQTKWVGEFEVQAKPGVASITDMKLDREFVYFNINGGDSWGYYHPVTNFEYIHNFKGEPSYATKELFPEYYKDCQARRTKLNATPTETGELVLAFRDLRTASYWNGTWNAGTHELAIHPAKSETQLDHFLQSKGRSLGEFVPIWTLEFDPTNPVIVNEDEKTINTFVLSPFLRAEHKAAKNLDACPLIKKIILSAVSNNEWDETTEHFLNWLAVIYQHRVKTGTAWILHGAEGTGKGLLIHNILAPTLGETYVQARRASELEEKYSGWLERSLIAMIDEAEIDASTRKNFITGDMKNFITDKKISIRHMNQASYTAPSFTNFILASNAAKPANVPKNDRRYNVGHFQHTMLKMTQAEIKRIVSELPAFVDYIMTRKACIDTAAQVLRTESRDEIIQASRTSVDMVADALLEGDLAFLHDTVPDMKLLAELHGANSAYAVSFANIVKREVDEILRHNKRALARNSPIVKHDRNITRDEMLVIFEYCVGNMPQSPTKFSRLLTHHGIKVKKVRTDEGTAQGIQTTWVVTREWLEERRAEQAEQKPKLARVK